MSGGRADPDGTEEPERLSTGIAGLDEILQGGLIPERSYIVRGDPGTGKTILGLHFLTAGVDAGETSLFINLEETTADVEQNAASLGVDLTDVEFLDLSPGSDFFGENRAYDVFESSAVDRDPLTSNITARIDELSPDRVFVDPLTQLRDLTGDDYQFRKQSLSFMRLLSEYGATVLFTTQATATSPDDDLQYLSDGTIQLGTGRNGRGIDVPKFRGSGTRPGDHAMEIDADGITVHPAIRPRGEPATHGNETIPFGVPELDSLTSGGIERGTVTIISGPTGVGKTTTGTQFMHTAAERGERSVVYLFEESRSTFLGRSDAIGIPLSDMLEAGTLDVREVEPLSITPQGFASMVRSAVEERDAKVVMIDGVGGYRVSLRGDEDDLVTRLHALNRYLKEQGVTVILVDEVRNVTGEFYATNSNMSYLADNILFLRHIEFRGELRKAVGMLKKRTSTFERTLREFEITSNGIAVGEPLSGLQGILSGTPDNRSSARHEGG